MPFMRDGIKVSCEIVAAVMESLNAEATRTLALKERTGEDRRVHTDGLDRHLARRGFGDPGVAETIAGILTEAGITEKASVRDWYSRKLIRGIRLLSGWTWTIATTGQKSFLLPVEGKGACDEVLAWTDLCPACRKGSLILVTGQRLFGIPETDFYVCRGCGAKYVPDGGRFRLVAITRIEDPLWKRHLNKTYTADEWAAIAAYAETGKTPAPKKTSVSPKTTAPGTGSAPFTRMNDGTLGFTCENQTYYFRPLRLDISRGSSGDLFSKATEKVRDLIRRPEYNEVRPVVEAQYNGYLDLNSGAFISELKRNHNPLYLSFLNPYGDREYCRFRITCPESPGTKGVWIVVIGKNLRAAGICRERFAHVFNDRVGSILPAACYRDGDPESCRTNALICRNRKDAGVYVYPTADEKEMGLLSAALLPLCI
ncbi:MAG: hypothetical protein OS112_03475 [Methanoregula sp.]|nr:MAG: hypothetical protein OS112_03475 [Methanoregula sp.]